MPNRLRKGQVISQYIVKELLPEGSGGMATIVRAIRKDGLDVALKISRVTDEQYFADALLAEVEILRKLDHPGIIRILPIDPDSGKIRYMERALELEGQPWYFVMEYLEGGSLRDYLKRSNIVTLGEATAIAFDIALALRYMHSIGYAHNDIKTDNIVFKRHLVKNSSFSPVLIDFGIAAKLKQIRHAGSLQWMSPERLRQIRGELAPEIPVDATKVDIYSMGVLLYQMLAGKLPFGGPTESSLTSAILHKTPDRLAIYNSQIPLDLDKLVMACMSKRPGARPTTELLIEELAKYKNDLVVTVPKNKGLFGWF